LELVPIKVKIGLRPNGHADHPDFNQLPSVKASGVDWAYHIDAVGSGWLYDCCGHKEAEDGSPFGMQWGMLLLPAVLAAEAVTALPGVCTAMSEAEAEAFYDNQHQRDAAEEIIDEFVLKVIEERQKLGLPLTATHSKALDPTDDQPGIRANHDKTFVGYKARRGITLAR